MKRHLLLSFGLVIIGLFCAVSGASAQQTIQRYLRLTDGNFNPNNWGTNAVTPIDRSIRITDHYNSVAWNYTTPIDLSVYDKVHVSLADVQYVPAASDGILGTDDNGMTCVVFRIVDNNNKEYSHRIYRNELGADGFDIDVSQPLYTEQDEEIDRSQVKAFVLWTYDGCNITFNSISMTRKLAAGEEDYCTTPFVMTNEAMNYKSEDGTVLNDSTWYANLYAKEGSESFIGWDWSAQPKDFSAYNYLVVVPKYANSVEEPATASNVNLTQYRMEDASGNMLESQQFRHAPYNYPRAIVIDLKNFKETYRAGEGTDDQPLLADYDVSKIAKFYFANMWGGDKETGYGFSAIYLSNTAPTWSGEAWGSAQTLADYVRTINDADANLYTTICLPYAAAVTNADAYTVKGIDETRCQVVLTPYTGILKAGVPYVLKTLSAQTVTFYRAGANEVLEGSAANGLTGQLEAKVWGEGTQSGELADPQVYLYDEAKEKWVAATDDGSHDFIEGNYAYLDANTLPRVNATDDDIAMDIEIDDATAFNGPTGIKELNGDETKTVRQATYNLAGQRVSDNYKGVVIKNGKKYINK